jgi:hypothetical protein
VIAVIWLRCGCFGERVGGSYLGSGPVQKGFSIARDAGYAGDDGDPLTCQPSNWNA